MFSFVSLFTGIGGFDLGLERAGMTCKQQVEIDDKCNEVLAYHWPDIQRFGDVRDVGRHNLKAVDLITGGFPCQDVSVAGKRTGLAGKRSGLWFEFHRVLEELGPRWVVVENVPGLLSSNGGRDFAVILRGLVELRYGVCWRVFDAQYDGVAQRRRRVFIVGSLGDGCAAEVLFERESGAWDSPPSRETRENVAASLKAGTPSRRGGGSWPIAEEFVVSRDAVPIAIEIHGGSKRKDRPQGGFYVREMSTSKPLDTSGLNPNCAQGGQIVQHALSAHNQRNDPVIARPLAHGQTTNHYDESQQTFIVSRDAVPKTSGGMVTDLRAGNPHISAVLSGMGVRRLTPLECERLQGFPDFWTAWGVADQSNHPLSVELPNGKALEPMSDSARYRMLGNAVCVPVAEWIGRRIMQVEFDSEKGI